MPWIRSPRNNANNIAPWKRVVACRGKRTLTSCHLGNLRRDSTEWRGRLRIQKTFTKTRFENAFEGDSNIEKSVKTAREMHNDDIIYIFPVRGKNWLRWTQTKLAPAKRVTHKIGKKTKISAEVWFGACILKLEPPLRYAFPNEILEVPTLYRRKTLHLR